MATARTTSQDRYRKQLLRKAPDEKGRVQFWRLVRSYSWWDEIGIGLVLWTILVTVLTWIAGLIGSATADEVPDVNIVRWFASIGDLFPWLLHWTITIDVTVAVAFIATLPLTARRVGSSHAKGVLARWVDVSIARGLNEAVDGIEVLTDSIEFGDVSDPPESVPSVLKDRRYEELRFDVKLTTKDWKLQALCDTVARVAGYTYGIPEPGSNANTVVHVLLVRDAQEVPWPIDPGDLETYWPHLCHHLDLGTPQLRDYVVLDEPDRPALHGGNGIFTWMPTSFAARIFPDPSQDTDTAHAQLLRRLQVGFGVKELETEPYTPADGLLVRFWTDGRPSAVPCPVGQLEDRWLDVARAIGFKDDAVPTLLGATWVGTLPEQPMTDGLKQGESFLAKPRPEELTLQLDVPTGTHPEHVKQRIDAALGYEAVERVPARRNAGLVLSCHRDPLQLGNRVPLDLLGMGEEEMILGDTFAGKGTMVWRFVKDPMFLIAGLTGAGKGDLLTQICAQAIARGWFVVYINPKGHSEAEKLMRAMAEVTMPNGALDQVHAVMALARLETALRAWKIKQAATGATTDGIVRSIRDAAAYRLVQTEMVAAGRTQPWDLGSPWLIVMDESADVMPPLFDKDDNDGGSIRRATRANAREGVAKARFVEGHYGFGTQIPYVASIGDGNIKGNLSWQVLLQVKTELSFKLLDGLDKGQKSRLIDGHGKGHNFHTGITGPAEGQTFWVPDPDELADIVVPPYLEAQPDARQHRDFTVELRRALNLLDDGGFRGFPHEAIPYILGPTPINSWQPQTGDRDDDEQQQMPGTAGHFDDLTDVVDLQDFLNDIDEPETDEDPLDYEDGEGR